MSKVYMKQPRGYNDNTGKVCQLYKALNGTIESPKAWYGWFHNYLKILNLNKSKDDYYSCIIKDGKATIYSILLKDDLLICWKNEEK